MRKPAVFLLALLILLNSGYFSFASLIPDLAIPQAKNYPIIRTINVQAKNVFDPHVAGEDRFPFTWANVVHITTRSRVILRELLVHPGDHADPILLAESERNLRALPFIKEAHIVAVPTGDGRVDLIVQTQDTWTTQPQVNFGTAGNQSTFSTGILEENLLGYGKTLSVFYRKNSLTGSSQDFTYADPQLFGTRGQWSSELVNTPTGNEQHLVLTKPFYALETRTAEGLSWDHVLSQQQLITNGIQTSSYIQDHHNVDAFGGLWVNNDPLFVNRLSLHYRYTEDLFHSDPQTTSGGLPPTLKTSGPLMAWTVNQSRFIKETFLEKTGRIEDINLGHDASVSLGYSGRTFGATNDTIPLVVSDNFGFGYTENTLWLSGVGAVANYNTYDSGAPGGQLTNTLYYSYLNFYEHMPTPFPMTGVAHLESAYAQNADLQNQLQLGGDTGLRGYKVQAFTGNKSILFNLEERAFAPFELFHIAYIGGAAFFDSGEVQQPGLSFDSRNVHSDIGFGFRFGLARSTVGTVYRLDFAYALGPIQQNNRWVVSITAGQGFARTGNSYSKFPNLPPPPQ